MANDEFISISSGQIWLIRQEVACLILPLEKTGFYAIAIPFFSMNFQTYRIKFLAISIIWRNWYYRKPNVASMNVHIIYLKLFLKFMDQTIFQNPVLESLAKY